MNLDLARYRQAFFEEAGKISAVLNQNLLALEKKPTDSSVLQEIFRQVHTLKGMAATMGFETVTRLTHSMENILDRLRRTKTPPEQEDIERLFQAADGLELLIDGLSSDPPKEINVDPLLAALEETAGRKTGKYLKTEAVSQIKPARQINSIPVTVRLLDQLLNLVGELVIGRTRLSQVSDSLSSPELNQVTDDLRRLIRDLHAKILKTRIVPVEYIFGRFPRLVHDQSKKLKKEIELSIEGNEIGLDRVILDNISDALVHLINNAIAHGIESPEERKKIGKSCSAMIKLSARREQSYVEIGVSDDGKGIDAAEIRKTAVERKIITPEEAKKMSDETAVLLLTNPDFTTTRKITEISGRGVGMDAVMHSVETLGGTVRMESEKGRGTRVILRLPVTLAIIPVQLVKAGEETYAIPVSQIEEKPVQADKLPVVVLSELLGCCGTRAKKQPQTLVISAGGKRSRLSVDELTGQQDVVVKPLGSLIKNLREFAGATILSSGQIVLILDARGLMP